MKNKVEVDTKTLLRVGVVALVVVLLSGSIASLFGAMMPSLIILGAAAFLAIALNPLVSRLSKQIPGKNRGMATAVTYLGIVAVLTAILWIVIPAVVNETVKFVGHMPRMVEETTQNWGGINEFGNSIGVDNLQDQVMSGLQSFSDGFVANFGHTILTSAGAIGSALTAIILILVLSLLMVMEGPRLMSRFWRLVGNNKRAPKAERVVSRMADVVAKYVSGQLTVALIDSCVAATAVFVLALMFGMDAGLALPFGLITGIFSLIPLFGPLLGGILVALLLAFNSLWAGIAYLAFFILYLQIESNVITPKVMSKGMKLPALVVLAAITIGIYTFGMIGAIIAIPIAGCIKVLIEEYFTRSSEDTAK